MKSALCRLFTPALLGLLAAFASAAPMSTAFTYQGQLKANGSPLNGSVNLSLTLWSSGGSGNPPSGGTQIGAADELSNIQVTDGLFTVNVNQTGVFGPGASGQSHVPIAV